MFGLIFSLAVIFSPLAALAAYLITYQEYAHHYPDKRQVRKTAAQAAAFAFFVFLAVGMFLALILPFCL